jgi:hypothetical protein
MQSPAVFSMAAIALLAGALAAQEPVRGPDANTSTHVPGIVLLAIPNKPFSGTDTIEWTRTLEDGTTVTTHVTALVARDSQGRIYRENHHFVATGKTSPLYQIHIYDPVTRSQALCSTQTMECVLTDYKPQTFFESRGEGPFDDGNRSLARERLGSETIEGIYVSGTRETTTVNAGILGNDRPLVSTREFWYSEELQTNLAVTRIDPRTGKQAIWISGISRAEPDSHLFDLPIGYAVRDLRTYVRRKR